MASPRPSISPPRRLTWTYIGALTAIGVFVFAGERAMQASLAAEAETWNELAELEEERALANELIRTVILASRTDVLPESQALRETYAEELGELLRVWPVLIHRPGRTPAERNAAKSLQDTAIRARNALQSPLEDAPRETQIAFLHELDDTAFSTLSRGALWHEALGASVNRLRLRIASDHERTSTLATLIAGLLALTLVFEGWFLFRPISRKFALFLRRQHRLLDVTRGYEQRARDLAQTKESFLANVSHEIRTPLHGVLGMTDLLMRTELDTRQSEYIETIQSCGRSLLHLVDDVLDLAKLEAGEMKLESIEFELRALIEGVIEVASPTLKPGVDVFYVEDSSLPEKLIGDPERLRQILANLLNNACKFTLEGEIVVLARCLPGSQAEDGKVTTTLLEIEVQDSGIGLPEGSIARLFSEFTQADASTTRKHGGTGLGLSICRQLCTAMGGEISAEARTSGGSLFRFTAQVRQSNIQTASPSPRFEALSGKHILCVDAHPLGRRLLREKLERTGALIDTCAEPEDLVPRLAGARLAGIQFDAIVLDDRDGNLDLASILQALRERSLHPGRVVIDPLQPREPASRTPTEFTEHIARPLRIGHLFEALIRSMEDSLPEKPEEPESPLAAEPEPLLATPEEDEAAPRVLLAEDNEVNQKIAVMTLKRLGCLVEVAGDGREAVKQARTRNFDIIFMDCQMPVMDGFDATRMIRREEPKNVRVPIVALTANVFAEDREHCLEVGMDGFLPKPVTSGELREILTRFASKERVQGSGSAGL